MNKMDISIITPVYKGNTYLNNYMKKVSKACELKSNVEVILVNDSPEIEIEFDKSLIKNFEIRIINNKKNMGIHEARIVGLKNALGKYILFLDQDDEILENTLITQYKKITEEDGDMVLGNGFFEDKNGNHAIYKNNFSQNFASKKTPNILVRDFIVSPGQCLIKKRSISKYWIENKLSCNGTDDYLLWLLMFNENIKFVNNYEKIYIHKYTGENLSLNKEKMYSSQLNMLELLKENSNYSKKDFKLLSRTIKYKHDYKKSFIKETLKNLDIFIYNLFYKMVWKGYTVSENK